MRTPAATLLSLCLLTMTGCGLNGTDRRAAALPPGILRLDSSSVRPMLSVQPKAAATSSYMTAVLASNPVAYYRLSDQGSSAADATTHHLTGMYGGGVRHTGPLITSGESAPSAMFPGSSPGSNVPENSVTVAPNSAFSAAVSALSVEAWIRPNALNATNHFMPLISYGREAIGQPWVIQLSPQSTLNVWMKLKGSAVPFLELKSGTTLSPLTAYHIVATYDGNVARLYINGSLNASTGATGSLDYSSTDPGWGLSIGGALGGNEPIFDGALSDVSIYATVLSAATIASHYTLGRIAAVPSPSPQNAGYTSLISASNPLSYYKLDDRSSTLSDSGANGLSGSYGANVKHAAAPLTSASDVSSQFPGSPPGSNVAANAATVPANGTFQTAASALTVEAWIQPSDYNRTGNYQPIVCYGRGIIGSAWCLQISPQSTLDFFLKGNTGYDLTSGTRLEPGQSYQVVATYNGSTIQTYVNGQLIATMPATGPIDYSGITAQYGLAIGGSLGFTRPIFNGFINDVSIYSHTLTPAQILQHYVSGQIAQSLNEVPVANTTFIDSIGVVTHLRSTATPYTDAWPQFTALIAASGIRHIGDSLIASPSWYPAHLQTLAGLGIHANLITDLSQTRAELAAALPLFAGVIEGVEGPNEPDISGDPNWIGDTRAFQDGLWSLVKGNPKTAYLPVIGPSIVYASNSSALGDLSAVMDEGSIHDYFNGLNPGTSGWGDLSELGIYGSIDWNMNVAALVSGARPIVSTETGYGTAATSSASVDSRTLARYVPRIYLEHFLHGIRRSTIYEFYDEPVTSEFSNFGLVDVANKPKASYYALKSLIGALTGRGSSAPQALRYTLSGNLGNVHHLLIQTAAQTYALVLWVETQSYDAVHKTDLAVPLQTVLVTPAQPATALKQSVIGDTGNLTSVSPVVQGGTLTLQLDDHVTIVSFQTAP